MNKEKLLTIVYKYYPKDIDCISDKKTYVKSNRCKILFNKIRQHQKIYPKETIALKNELETLSGTEFKLNDATYFEWQDRCYTFEFIKNTENITLILKFHQSIIAPFFFVQYFQIKNNKNSSRYFKIPKEEFQHTKLVKGIYNIAEKKGLKEFDLELAKKKIPDINFDDIPMGEFTYFNAFFNSQNM